MFPTTEAAAYYLAALIDGEGCITYKRYGPNKGIARYVRITNSERALIDAGTAALEALEIPYVVYYRSDRARRSNVFGTKPLWDVSVGQRCALERILEMVPIQHPEKLAKLRAAVASYPPRRPDRDTLARLLAEHTQREVGAMYGVSQHAVYYWKRSDARASEIL